LEIAPNNCKIIAAYPCETLRSWRPCGEKNIPPPLTTPQQTKHCHALHSSLLRPDASGLRRAMHSSLAVHCSLLTGHHQDQFRIKLCKVLGKLVETKKTFVPSLPLKNTKAAIKICALLPLP
jgi:hypothetical protein